MNTNLLWISVCVYPIILWVAYVVNQKSMEGLDQEIKKNRYKLLPWYIKGICPIGVCGGAALIPVSPGLFSFISFLSMFLVDILAHRWYKKNKLL